MSNANNNLSHARASIAGRPLNSFAVACAAGITIGTKNGSDNIGNSSSDNRVFAAIALKSVPTATSPMAARSAIPR